MDFIKFMYEYLNQQSKYINYKHYQYISTILIFCYVIFAKRIINGSQCNEFYLEINNFNSAAKLSLYYQHIKSLSFSLTTMCLYSNVF